MRTVKEYKVVKTSVYIDENGLQCETEDVASFSNETDAEWFCEDNVEHLCSHNNECLEVRRCFNEDDITHVIASYYNC